MSCNEHGQGRIKNEINKTGADLEKLYGQVENKEIWGYATIEFHFRKS